MRTLLLTAICLSALVACKVRDNASTIEVAQRHLGPGAICSRIGETYHRLECLEGGRRLLCVVDQAVAHVQCAVVSAASPLEAPAP